MSVCAVAGAVAASKTTITPEAGRRARRTPAPSAAALLLHVVGWHVAPLTVSCWSTRAPESRAPRTRPRVRGGKGDES